MSINPDKLDRAQLKELALKLKNEGQSDRNISQLLNIPRATIYDWVNNRTKKTIKTTIIEEESYLDDNDNPVDVITEPDNDPFFMVSDLGGLSPVPSPVEMRKKKIEEFLENREWKTYDAPERTKLDDSPNDVALVIGDTHFGVHCNDTLNIFYKIVEELKPKKIILNGDTLDLLAVSKYTKDPRYTHSIMDEINSFWEFLKVIHDITANYNTEILETNGNHSGNGIEGRWWRYFSTSNEIKELLKIPHVAESLSYSSVFHPKWEWSRLKLIEADDQNASVVELPDQLFVLHSDIVRKNGGFSARGNYEKYGASTITNHTHRMGSSYQRISKFGSRPERQFMNYENGCACKLNPTYVTSANWQNGFSIVHYNETEDTAGVELVKINNKKANVVALGKTIKA